MSNQVVYWFGQFMPNECNDAELLLNLWYTPLDFSRAFNPSFLPFLNLLMQIN